MTFLLYNKTIRCVRGCIVPMQRNSKPRRVLLCILLIIVTIDPHVLSQ